MIDYSHLDALQQRAHHEKTRLDHARVALESAPRHRRAALENEIAFRQREIASCEKEIAGEYRFLGISPPSIDDVLTDDDLLAELLS